ncbi:MAG: protein-disulfide reductase DsbD N-terminal domain-containing protein [Pyrinomonadaceae bacterium]
MRSKIFILVHACAILLLALIIAGCAKTENAPTNDAASASNIAPSSASNASPRAEIVRAETNAVEAAGNAPEAFVRVKIAEGFHIHANPPTLPNLIATELKIESDEANAGITAGAPVYPAPVTRKFDFSEQPLRVYEGEVVIKLPLRVEASAAKGEHRLRAKLRTQACDNQACYPPRTIETFIAVNVR